MAYIQTRSNVSGVGQPWKAPENCVVIPNAYAYPCWLFGACRVPREAEVVDGLVKLLIQVTHRITVKAERRVVDELVEEAYEVRGKAGILSHVVEAASGSPEGVVRELIFPVIGTQTFEALVREARVLGTPRSRRVHTAARASYGSY